MRDTWYPLGSVFALEQTLLVADDTHEVFSLFDSAAVDLMTSIDKWSGIKMEHVTGAFLAQVTAQSGIIHDYKFRVNGKWCTALGVAFTVSVQDGMPCTSHTLLESPAAEIP